MFDLKLYMFVYNIILIVFLNFDHMIFSFLYRKQWCLLFLRAQPQHEKIREAYCHRKIVNGSVRAPLWFRRRIAHPLPAMS